MQKKQKKLVREKPKSKSPLNENKNEIIWNLINSGIAGGIAFFSGIIAANEINERVIVVTLAVGGLAAFTQFKDYWKKEKREYSIKLFKFV